MLQMCKDLFKFLDDNDDNNKYKRLEENQKEQNFINPMDHTDVKVNEEGKIINDENKEYEEKLQIQNFEIYLEDKDYNHPNEDEINCKKIFVYIILLVIPTILPFILCCILIYMLDSRLEQFIMSLFLIFIFLLIFLGVLLLKFTNEDSISGMVAQRFNKISYLTILLIGCVSFFTSCFILCGAITREKLNKTNDYVTVACATFSPIITFLILIFPIVVYKTEKELGMKPNSDDYKIVVKRKYSNLRTKFTFEMKFYKCCSVPVHTLMHFFVVISGVVLGYYSIIKHLSNKKDNYKWVFELLFLVISIIYLLLFAVFDQMNVNREKSSVKRIRLYTEFIGLYYYMVCMIYVSVVAGDVISDF